MLCEGFLWASAVWTWIWNVPDRNRHGYVVANPTASPTNSTGISTTRRYALSGYRLRERGPLEDMRTRISSRRSPRLLRNLLHNTSQDRIIDLLFITYAMNKNDHVLIFIKRKKPIQERGSKSAVFYYSCSPLASYFLLAMLLTSSGENGTDESCPG